jgi:hypothetical protein
VFTHHVFDACSIKNDSRGLFLQLVLWMEGEIVPLAFALAAIEDAEN